MMPFIIKFTFQQNIRNVKQSTTMWINGSQFSTQQMSVLEMSVAVSEVCTTVKSSLYHGIERRLHLHAWF
jgi:hypothetical protein